MTDWSTVAENICRIRKQRRWTQEWLARTAQVDARTVRRAEEGLPLSPEDLRVIAKALESTVEDLQVPSDDDALSQRTRELGGGALGLIRAVQERDTAKAAARVGERKNNTTPGKPEPPWVRGLRRLLVGLWIPWGAFILFVAFDKATKNQGEFIFWAGIVFPGIITAGLPQLLRWIVDGFRSK